MKISITGPHPEKYRRRIFTGRYLKNVNVYFGTYNPLSERGQDFTIEKFNDSSRMVSKLSAASVFYDTAKHKWTALNYYIRTIDGNTETFTTGYHNRYNTHIETG